MKLMTALIHWDLVTPYGSIKLNKGPIPCYSSEGIIIGRSEDNKSGKNTQNCIFEDLIQITQGPMT